MNDSLRNAFGYLAGMQQTSGGFGGFSSSQESPFTASYSYQTVFVPALMLSALHAFDDRIAIDIKKRLAKYVLGQKSEYWSFNYWQRDSPESHLLPYPDDLDDTFCALAALWLYDSTLVDEAALAHIVKLLIATETKAGGPYKTWLAPKDAAAVWRDTDIAVNANVAYFLSLAVEPLPNLTSFLGRAITTQTFVSPYYPNEYPIIYFISRAYNGPQKNRLAAYILAKQHPTGGWGSPLKTALAMSSLHYLGRPVPKGAERQLLAAQQPDGSWPSEAFCIDPNRDGRTFYHGSEALSTAFALEALYRHERRPAQVVSHVSLPILQETEAKAADLLKILPAPIGAKATKLVARTVRGRNGEEIILLPRQFYLSLRQPPHLADETYASLALGSLCGWAAYTIYDDFIDDEADPHLLPAATIMMRQSLQAFLQIASNSAGWQQFVNHTFDKMDAANAWELAYCRYTVVDGVISIGKLPPYGRLSRLAERSWGHALAPMGVLAAAGISPTDPSAQLLHKALHHYLIARQLNDDAHDWQEDLRAGRITYVVAELLRLCGTPPGEHELDALCTGAEQKFWRYALGGICEQITYHTARSRKLLQRSKLLVPGGVIERLLDRLDAIAKEARDGVGQAERFLQVYNDS